MNDETILLKEIILKLSGLTKEIKNKYKGMYPQEIISCYDELNKLSIEI